MGWFKDLLKGGFKFEWTSGKPFDPHNQKRTDAMDDLVRSRKKKSNLSNTNELKPRIRGGKSTGKGRGGCK